METTLKLLNAGTVWFTDQKEEAYFELTFTLPRIATVTGKFSADRYVASIGFRQEAWTNWRIIPRDTIRGVGPKTYPKVQELAEAAITAWLDSADYRLAKQKAVARWIIDKITRNIYGTKDSRAILHKWQKEITFYDLTRITTALDHLEAAEKLLDDSKEDDPE